jgi:hypothetical protein
MRRSRGGTVTHPLQWALTAVGRVDPRARLGDRVALSLREQLPPDSVVLARHAPRDHGERIPVVIIDHRGLVVIEPRDDEGDLVCYQDHWYRRIDGRVAQSIGDPPSLRARANAARLKSDLGTGGVTNVPVDALVLLTRGRPEDVRSSCVPVIAGLDPLIRHLLARDASPADPKRTRAVIAALAHNINLAMV